MPQLRILTLERLILAQVCFTHLPSRFSSMFYFFHALPCFSIYLSNLCFVCLGRFFYIYTYVVACKFSSRQSLLTTPPHSRLLTRSTLYRDLPFPSPRLTTTSADFPPIPSHHPDPTQFTEFKISWYAIIPYSTSYHRRWCERRQSENDDVSIILNASRAVAKVDEMGGLIGVKADMRVRKCEWNGMG